MVETVFVVLCGDAVECIVLIYISVRIAKEAL